MFLLREPSAEWVDGFLREQQDAPFTYREVGSTRNVAPPCYAVSHRRVRLGTGEETFERAAEAVLSWRMFDVGWARVIPADARPETGTTVGVMAHHLGFRSLGGCRVVYRIEEDDRDVKRRGFAYGTLPSHVERGEERFMVEMRQDGSVFYDLYAFSFPNHPLTLLGFPLARTLQKRFSRDSLQAMVRAAQFP